MHGEKAQQKLKTDRYEYEEYKSSLTCLRFYFAMKLEESTTCQVSV
jgi:hypothetical protein